MWRCSVSAEVARCSGRGAGRVFPAFCLTTSQAGGAALGRKRPRETSDDIFSEKQRHACPAEFGSTTIRALRRACGSSALQPRGLVTRFAAVLLHRGQTGKLPAASRSGVFMLRWMHRRVVPRLVARVPRKSVDDGLSTAETAGCPACVSAIPRVGWDTQSNRDTGGHSPFLTS